jgi:hypothetical protein
MLVLVYYPLLDAEMIKGMFAATGLKWVVQHSQTDWAYQLLVDYTWESTDFKSHHFSIQGTAKRAETTYSS